MGIYDRSATTALRMLTKYGQAVTMSSIATGSYDPATGTQATTTTTATHVGALTNHNAKDIDGSLIMQGDKKLLLNAGASIKTDDTVTISNVVYSIAGISEINPAGTRVMWICNVRASV